MYDWVFFDKIRALLNFKPTKRGGVITLVTEMSILDLDLLNDILYFRCKKLVST